MFTQEFIAAEVAYRTEQLTHDYQDANRQRSLRDLLHLGKHAHAS
ncbi:MAG: hypothetical protein ABI912_06250 [Actinomycetota bacterium]